MKNDSRKVREKLNRKNAIIDGAEEVFFNKGFYNSTMDDIARQAEFTKKTIYSYFNSKEEIYYEIMLRGYKILNSMNDEIFKKKMCEDEIENIKIMGETYIEFAVKYEGYFKAILDYKNNDDLKGENVNEELFNECYKEGEHSLELLKDCIMRGVNKGQITDKYEPTDICLTLWSCILGFSNIVQNKENYIKKFHNKTSAHILETEFKIVLGSIIRR